MLRPARLLGLAALAATLAGGALAQTNPPLSFVQPLSEEATEAVQRKLREAGAYRGGTDGVWGPESQAALDRFQQARGLAVTGAINLATAQALGLAVPELLPGAQPVAVPVGGLSDRAVRNIQQRLKTLGFYDGALDAIWGPSTQTALQRFQRGRALEATGQVNPATAQALGLNPNNLEEPPR
jgi:peptidoglycan hydrolase-like protein with peptidoglycan-binding domain